MSARLSGGPDPRFSSGTPSGARPSRDRDIPLPPRAMARAAKRGNRRRAWPRWAKPALKTALLGLPLVAAGVFALSVWRAGAVGETMERIEEAMVSATAAAGFALREVVVDGRVETSSELLFEALGARQGTPILGVDLVEAKERLESLPWVSSASVERRLPDALYVRLSERQPMAIWQHERAFTVIDREGRPLADALEMARKGSQRVNQLPHVVGANAPQQVPKLLAALEEVPEINKRLAAAVWVSDRRWDLQLDNGMMIRLPEAGMVRALRQLAEMQTGSSVLDRDVVAVDLRQKDRAVLQTSTAAVPDADDRKRRRNGNKP